MYKNKHVVVALLVAPILAVLSYFGVDQIVSEKPKPAVKGSAYVLVEKPNCRYSSGVCELKNGDFEVRMTPTVAENGQSIFTLTSAVPLQGGRIGLSSKLDQTVDAASVALESVGGSTTEWQFVLPVVDKTERLQLAFSSSDVIYYGEASLAFLDYETSFGKDFRHQ